MILERRQVYRALVCKLKILIGLQLILKKAKYIWVAPHLKL